MYEFPGKISPKQLADATKLLTFIKNECKSIIDSLPAIKAAVEADAEAKKEKDTAKLKPAIAKVDAAIDAIPAESLADIIGIADRCLNAQSGGLLKKLAIAVSTTSNNTVFSSTVITIRRMLLAIQNARMMMSDGNITHTHKSFRSSLHNEIEAWRNYHTNPKDMMSDISALAIVIVELTKLLKSMQAKLKKTSETPRGDKGKLGRVALGQNRIDGAPYEKNTKIEDELFDELLGHFNHDSKLDKKSVAMIKQFIKTGEYSKVFAEPDEDIVYRGMGVSWEWLEKALKKKRDKIPNRGSITRSITYTPIAGEGASSSWSTEKKRADQFGKDNNKRFEGGGHVVLLAYSGDNGASFSAGPNGLYRVADFASYKDEKEVVGLGKIKAFKLEWDMGSK